MGKVPKHCTIVLDIDRFHREILYWHHLNAIYLSKGKHQKSKSCFWGNDTGGNVVISCRLLWLLSSPSYTCWFWVLFLNVDLVYLYFVSKKTSTKSLKKFSLLDIFFFICVIFSMKGNHIIYLLKPEKQQTNS